KSTRPTTLTIIARPATRPLPVIFSRVHGTVEAETSMSALTSRRRFLATGLGVLASVAARPLQTAAASSDRLAIVNADDFGMSAEIDRGILEAHDRALVKR